MPEFTNTVDIVGDDALTDSIIDRSIDECRDNAVSLIGDYAFYKCTKLTTADFPAVTNIGTEAFQKCSALTTAKFPAATIIGDTAFNGCSKLEIVDFRAATIIGGSAFQGCNALTTLDFPAVTIVHGYAFRQCASLTTLDFPVANNIYTYAFYYNAKLTALILRNQSQVATLNGVSAFEGTPIASGTGYIYVPRDLVDTYKSATNWSTYANQFRALEDYTVDGTVTGEFVMPITWDDVSSWIADGTYKDHLSIGDTVPLDLGTEGIVNMQIVAFDADEKADGSGKAPITWIAKDLLVNSYAIRTSSDTTGGWALTSLRSWLQGDFYNAMPAAVKNAIVPVNKTYYDLSKATKTCVDTVWIPSYREVFGDASKYPCETSGVEYTGSFSTVDSLKKGNSWWLRSVYGTYAFGVVTAYGEQKFNATVPIGVIIGFCT